MGLVNRVLQKGANAIGNKAGKVITDLASEGIESGAKFATAEAVAIGAEKIGSKAAIAEARVAAKAGNSAAVSALTFLGAPLEETAEQAAKEATKETVKEVGKKAVKSGIKGHALLGAGAGAIVGAGGGGLTAMATGADDDNTKAMIVTGAIAGAATGGIVGGGAWAKRNKAVTGHWYQQVAEDIANGPSNQAVGGGAKGLFSKAGASIRNFTDNGVNTLDDIGEHFSNKVTNKALTKNLGYNLNEMEDIVNTGMMEKEAFDNVINNVSKKANVIGGAAQGAIMGSAGGALIGGVAGGIDEDETFIGGALKGGFIGGSLGGIGGGISGYANNSARLLKNTTQNVNSLFG